MFINNNISRIKKKIIKIVCLVVELVGTADFGVMWGITGDQTYKFENGTIKGIGINNYNNTWNKENELQLNVNPFSSYQAFLSAYNKGSNKSLINAVNINYNLWISEIVLTSISVLLSLTTLIIIIKNFKK